MKQVTFSKRVKGYFSEAIMEEITKYLSETQEFKLDIDEEYLEDYPECDLPIGIYSPSYFEVHYHNYDNCFYAYIGFSEKFLDGRHYSSEYIGTPSDYYLD